MPAPPLYELAPQESQGHTPEFLPRLQPATFGTWPLGPFAQRWYGRAGGLDVMVASKRPVNGVSQHLACDRLGHWIAYEHHQATGARSLRGHSARGRRRLGFAFGV